jgi:thiol:disulfide interchange protein DsbD
MVWVRKIFGFVLIAMALTFLRPLLPNTLFYHFALALTMFVAGIYMAWIEPTKTSGRVFPAIRSLVGILFLATGLVMAVSGIQEHVDNVISEKIRGIQGDRAAGKMVAEIRWEAYSEEKIAEAGRLGRPVLIDFYADWCIPCKELDKFVFSDPDIISVSQDFMMVKADLTTARNPQVVHLRQKYRVRGIPTLVFLTSRGDEMQELRVVGFEEKEIFLSRMKRALDINPLKDVD